MVNLNNMNMLNMNNQFGSSFIGNGNVVNSLFCGTNSIFDTCSNMFNNFGMLGSNYNMFGFGQNLFMNPNGSFNWGAMAGLAVGNTLLNFGGLFLGAAIQNKRENSTESLDSKAEDIYQDLKKARKDKSAAEQKKQALEKELPTLKQAVEDTANAYDIADKYINNNKDAYEDAVEKKNKNETLSETEENIIKNYEEYKAELPELEKAKNAAEKAVSDQELKIQEQQDIIDSLALEIEELEKAYKEADAAFRRSYANKADGTRLSRNKNLNVDSITEGYSNLTKGDIQQLVHQFINLPDGTNDKLKYAKALTQLDGAAYTDIATNSQLQVREWAIEYYEKHKPKN